MTSRTQFSAQMWTGFPEITNNNKSSSSISGGSSNSIGSSNNNNNKKEGSKEQVHERSKIKEHERNTKHYYTVKEVNKFTIGFQVGEEIHENHNTPAAKYLK